MKVYISVDMEGVACVTHRDHVKSEGTEYEMARKWMTAEANAAIEGALEAGATEVIVADAHGSMRNILPDALHEEALLVRGSPRPLITTPGLDGSIDAALLVGQHSRAGTAQGILAHSYASRLVYALRLNDQEVGEPGFTTFIAGHFGVPVALVCGDDTVEAEVAGLMPATERVITKWAISPLAARNLTPMAAQKRIREGAKRALSRLSEMEPLVVQRPVRFEVVFMHPVHATVAEDIPGVERVDGRTLIYTGADMLEVARVWRLILNAVFGDYWV
jgi:D-amino peptidase